MSKRINIVLPDKTVAVLDRVTTKGNRSRFIDRAVRRLVEVEGKANLRLRLKEEALANADRDLEMAAEWFPLEEEVSQRMDRPSEKAPKKVTQRKQA
jgi:CopG family transcriptional regulator / antitoxin EndoAI